MRDYVGISFCSLIARALSVHSIGLQHDQTSEAAILCSYFFPHLAFMILLLLLFHLKAIILLHLFLPVFRLFSGLCDDEFTRIIFVNVFESAIVFLSENWASKHDREAKRRRKCEGKSCIVTRPITRTFKLIPCGCVEFLSRATLDLLKRTFRFCFPFSSAKHSQQVRPKNFFSPQENLMFILMRIFRK